MQGPLAVRYCTKVNEPIADIVNGIHDGWVDIITKTNSKQPIREIEYLSPPVPSSTISAFASVERSVKISMEAEPPKKGEENKVTAVKVTIRLPHDKNQLPNTSVWYEWLCAGKNSWWRALLTSPHIVQGKKYVANPFIRLLEPAVNQRYEIRSLSKQWHEQVVEIALFDDMVGQSVNGSSTALVTAPLKHKPVLKITKIETGFTVTIYHPIPVSSSPTSSLRWEMIPLTLRYRYGNVFTLPPTMLKYYFLDTVQIVLQLPFPKLPRTSMMLSNNSMENSGLLIPRKVRF